MDEKNKHHSIAYQKLVQCRWEKERKEKERNEMKTDSKIHFPNYVIHSFREAYETLDRIENTFKEIDFQERMLIRKREIRKAELKEIRNQIIFISACLLFPISIILIKLY